MTGFPFYSSLPFGSASDSACPQDDEPCGGICVFGSEGELPEPGPNTEYCIGSASVDPPAPAPLDSPRRPANLCTAPA